MWLTHRLRAAHALPGEHLVLMLTWLFQLCSCSYWPDQEQFAMWLLHQDRSSDMFLLRSTVILTCLTCGCWPNQMICWYHPRNCRVEAWLPGVVLAAYEHRGRSRADLCRKAIGKAIENYDAIGTPLKTHGKPMGKPMAWENPWENHGNTKLLTLDLHSPGNPRCPKSMAATRKGFAWFCLRKGDKKFTQLCCCRCQVQLPLG